jgi:dTDP-4-amino-4,6-dideoxygalactose transaminase
MHRLAFGEWTRAELGAALAALLARQTIDGPALAVLRTRLAALLGDRPLFLLSRGRVALEIALATFAERRPLCSEVVFPAYICPSVIDAIRACRLSPVAAEVGADLNLDPGRLRERLSARTLAVVTAHMYAAPAAIAEIEAICAGAGVFLVDDAAQVVGIAAEGRPLGTFGNCGLLSFSQSKTVVAGIGDAGGVLIANDPELSGALRRRCEALPPGEYGAADFLRSVAEVPLQGRAMATRYYAARLGGILYRPEGGSGYRYRPRQMPNALAAVALRQLDSLPRRLAGRARAARAYADRLADPDGPTLPQYAPGLYLTRVLALLPPGLDAIRARSVLAARGIQTRASYPLDAALTADIDGIAERAARLVEIPSHSTMDEATVTQIAAALRQTCASAPDRAGGAVSGFGRRSALRTTAGE